MDKKTIFFVDIDGTLIGEDFVLGEKVIQGAKMYQALGGELVLCTGRSVFGTKHIAEGLGIGSPAVLYNGAMIYDFGQEKVLWRKPMDKGIIENIRQIYKEHPEICIEVFTEKNIYRIRTNWMVENKGVPQERGVLFPEIPEIREDILKITLIADHAADLKGCREYFPEEQYRFDFSGRHFAELVKRDSGKHLAARELLRYLGVDYGTVFAAGNGENDIELLRQSDCAFVPVTADERVRRYADYMIDIPRQNGMKKAFEFAAGYKQG